MFSVATYQQRRNRLKSEVGDGLILFLGNGESSINFKDNWYPFRQDSTFLYFTGLDTPELFASFDCDSGEETLYGDDLSIDTIVWTGPQPTIAARAEKAGIANSQPIEKLTNQIKEALAAGRKVHILPPYRHEHRYQISEFTGWKDVEIDQHISEQLINSVVDQRNIKSSEEIKELDHAVTVTAEMHIAAMKAAKPGLKEYQLVAKVQETALSLGGQIAFPPIVTKNGQTLHNHYYGNTIAAGDMVLCDTGAELASGYCGDMTRTFPVASTFDSRQEALYNIVLDAHLSAVEALKPGISYREVHLLACSRLFEGLKAVGLTKGNTDEAVNAGAHTMFFQCGLGHLIGMDVHDMENLGEQLVGYTPEIKKSTDFGLKSLRLGRKLEAGFVLTVEPGIYIIPELIELWKAEKKHSEYLNYQELEKFKYFGGIRIEEDFVITDTGYELLGKPVPKTLEEIYETRS